MSLQDDYFDLSDHLQGTPQEVLLERIWFAFCREETEGMLRRNEINPTQYQDWINNREAEIAKLEDKWRQNTKTK